MSSRIGNSSGIFYNRFIVNSDAYPSEAQIILSFTAASIAIARDSGNLQGNPQGESILAFKFSRDNTVLDGELFEDDDTLMFDGLEEKRIWFRALETGDSIDVRVWAWRRRLAP